MNDDLDGDGLEDSRGGAHGVPRPTAVWSGWIGVFIFWHLIEYYHATERAAAKVSESSPVPTWVRVPM